MIKGHKIRKVMIMAVMLIGLITGVSIALTAGEGVFTAVTLNPDPIKLGSTASIQYTISQNSLITIQVYDQNGSLVRTLADNSSKIAGTLYQSWDGKDAISVLVPDGTYRIYLEAKDTAGTITGQAERFVTAARQPSISAISATPSPFNPLQGEQATISYSISSEALVTVTILNKVTPIRTIVANQLKQAGDYTLTWDGKDDSGNLAGDAQYTYQIEALSPVVATFKSTAKAYLTVEKENPQIIGFTATPDPMKISTNNLSLSYTLSENSLVTIKIVDSTGNLIQTILNNITKNAGYNTASWNGKDSLGNYVPEGSYTARISALDNFNNPSVEQLKTIAAGYQPAITGISDLPDPVNPLMGEQANFSFTISKDALVTITMFDRTFKPVRTVIANEPKAAGSYTIPWDGKDDAGNLVPDAAYTYQIEAVSPTVATFKSTVKAKITVEKEAPQIIGFNATPNPMKLSVNNLSTPYTLSEIAYVTVNVFDSAGNLVQTVLDGVIKNPGYNTASWNGKDSLGNYVPEGQYTATINAVDIFNKPSLKHSATITAGYHPAISGVSLITTPFNPVNGETALLNYTISQDANVNIIISNGATVVRTLTSNEFKLAGNYNIVWDGKDDVGNLVADKTYTYQIEAASPTVPAFKSTNKGSVVVEGRNPELTALSTTPTLVKIGYAATLRYTISEPAIVTVQIIDSLGQVVRSFPATTKANSGSYTQSWDTKADSGNFIESGTYYYRINAVDNFNKSGSAEITFQAITSPVIMNVNVNPQTVDVYNNINAKISYLVSERSFVTIKVYDANNVLYSTLASNKDVLDVDTITWDGTNTTGVKIAGTYTFKIDATSNIGSLKAKQVSGSVYVSNTSTTQGKKCIDCHTTYPIAHKVQNCVGCHGNDEPIQDCSTCHTNSTHTDGALLVKYECTFCHTDKYSYKVPLHPADIDRFHDTTTNMASCSTCHIPSLSLEHSSRSNPVTGQPYDCDTCHKSTRTEVQQAILNKQKNCDACHSLTHTGGANHDNSTFTALPKDADMDCALCHNSVLSDEHTSRKDLVTGLNYTCDTCHQSTRAEVKAAITTHNKNCEACHIDPVTNQPKVHTNSASPIHDTNYILNPDVNCAQCHNNNLKVEHLNNPARTTSTGQPITCETCHKSTNTSVTTAITNKDTKCSACHTYPTTKHKPNHATTVFTNDLSRTDGGTCVTCHKSTNLQTLHVGVATKAGVTMDCNTCHANTAAAVVTAISTKQTASCEACHMLHAPKDATVVHDSTDVFVATTDIECVTCHDRNVKKEHVDNPDRKTTTGLAITCDSCHSSSDTKVVTAISSNNTRCDACHTLPTTKHNPTHTASVFTSDTARTDLATCSLCHVKSLTGQHIGKTTTAGATMDCKTCHSTTAAAKVKLAIADKNGNCEACHTVHAPKAAVTQHDSTAVYVDNADVNCANCHSRNIKAEHIDNSVRTTATGQPITCDTCHGSTDAVIKTAIETNNTKCSACHTYPTTKHQPTHATNIYTTDTTRTDDCTMCHTTKNISNIHVGVTKSTGGVMDCNTCHTSTDPKVFTAINTKQTNSCEACHIIHPVKEVTTIHDSVNFTNNTITEPDMNCSNCHSQYLNTEHVNKTTEAGIVMTCDTCHKSTRTDVQTAIATNSKKCEACHTKVHTSQDPQHASTFVANKTMACEKCHNANSIANDHSNYKTTGALGTTAGQTITCTICHKSTNTSVVNAIRTSNTMCDACHTARHSDVQTPHKTTYFRETTSRCMSCHDPLGIKYSLSTTTNIAYHKVAENNVYYPTGASLTSTSTATDGGAFLTGYSRTTTLTCKGCHDTADGTATGATYSKLLKAPYGTNTTRSTTTHLCFKCHNSTFSGSAFSDHLDSHHINVACMTCHSTKIHSQSGRRHFIAIQGGEGSAYNSTSFRYGLRSYTHSTYGYSKSNCGVTCNGDTSH